MPFQNSHRAKPDIFYRSSETITKKEDFEKEKKESSENPEEQNEKKNHDR